MPKPTSITAHKHTDRRANIPTEELRDFVAEDENAPVTLRYLRDPSLDPQLVWQGKDAQDGEDLAVPAVPIYIQEKIHPQAIINDLVAQAAKPGSSLREEAAAYQLNMFADFNGGPEEFDQKVEFYAHEQNWANRLILGDSLLVMGSLAEKEGLRGRIQMIYLDPPYGIKFGSNWQVSTRKRDVKDGKAEDATRQPEQIRAFRDTWKLGIHSYLAYLRDRLVIARELLTETGSVFVQINSENSHLLRNILDEVFGSENFVADIYFRKKSIPLGAKYLETMHDQILFYAKDIEHLKFHHLYEPMDSLMLASHGPYALYPDGRSEKIRIEEVFSSAHPVGTRYYRLFSLLAPSFSASTVYQFDFDGRTFSSPNRGSWVVDKAKLEILAQIDRLQPEGSNLSYRLFYDDFPFRKRTNTWTDAAVSYEKSYVVQTSPDVIARCLLMTTDPGDLCLDPTCGSGTTAYVAEQWGRRWITCDTSRVALALARTRLMAARYPYYLLADSPEGVKKEMELSGAGSFGETTKAAALMTMGDLRKGFVYKRVPHVTLKSIANNEEIDAIHARWQETLEPLRAKINRLVGKDWTEWQVPRELPPDLTGLADLTGLHAQWWQARRKRQAEIDASITRRAETEALYDQPYEHNKRVRVAGPFTVESLSPHRVLATEEGEGQPGVPADAAADFTTMILDNLRKAGVQNTRKAERLTFNRLDPYAGTWLHAAGEYADAAGKPRRVAVSIGPEHGTVGPQQVKEAAKEAVQGIGFDLLVVCGFAFDPHVSEEVRRYGALTVLPTKMNPDLAMGDELLKKTGAGNLFMVFGEPDVEIRAARSNDFSRSSATEVATTNQIVVEIKGVDVYDPTTGQIRNSSTDDIACWFIDTDYDGESFFVRHAYFTGAEEPYDKLKRALRAEVDEAAWAALYRTVSRPFARPASGKVAVKVINHYGDEVLKVYDVASH